MSDEVVADVARVTEIGLRAPMVVREQLPVVAGVRRRVEQVADHLGEGDVVAAFKCLLRRVRSAKRAYDARPEALLVVVRRLRELVPVRRDEPLERMPDEDELEVCLKPLLDLNIENTSCIFLKRSLSELFFSHRRQTGIH